MDLFVAQYTGGIQAARKCILSLASPSFTEPKVNLVVVPALGSEEPQLGLGTASDTCL